MPKNKRIDKKKAVTFQLVHRSQQDPLIADENAPQRVLLPIEKEIKKNSEKQLEEQYKYETFLDDDYNYLEHLKDIKDSRMQWPEHVEKKLLAQQTHSNLKLPSSVFASEVEEEIGMLNKAAPISGPQLHLDPDIVAAMDEDFNYSDPENQLEDNFIELANGAISDQETDEEYESNHSFGNIEKDRMESFSGDSDYFEEEEKKSRFTNYSMTSSVIRRNEQLTLLDNRFEKMYADYEENEIGALDCEEIEGHVLENSDILLQYAEEFEKTHKRKQIDMHIIGNKVKEQLERNDEENEEELVNIPIPEKEKWDCESILSIYSNIYNHPKVICEPKEKIIIDKRTGIPKNVLGSNKLTVETLNKLNEENDSYSDRGLASVGKNSIISQLTALSIRSKDETPEERKERKKQLKEYQKERRTEKKQNTIAFKEEAKRQVKVSINNRNNIQGNKNL